MLVKTERKTEARGTEVFVVDVFMKVLYDTTKEFTFGIHVFFKVRTKTWLRSFREGGRSNVQKLKHNVVSRVFQSER